MNVCSMAFHMRAIAFVCGASVIGRCMYVRYVTLIMADDGWSMSRFNNDSVTFLTLSWCYIMVLASFYEEQFS